MALLANGKIVAWGNTKFGGEIPAYIQAQLIDVVQIYSNGYSYVALLANGKIVAWGDSKFGGEIPAYIQDELDTNSVVQIYSNNSSFAALLNNGNVITWGNISSSGKVPNIVQPLLKNVIHIYSTNSSFAALTIEGKIIVWGSMYIYDSITEILNKYSDSEIKLNSDTPLILKNINPKYYYNLSISLFSFLDYNPDLEKIEPINNDIQLTEITKVYNHYDNYIVKIEDKLFYVHQINNLFHKIYSNGISFVALLANGSIIAWGCPDHGGKIPEDIQSKLHSDIVEQIFNNPTSYVALTKSGKVFAWGNPDYGGKIPEDIQSKLLDDDVIQIYNPSIAYIALTKKGKVFAWGNIGVGGNIPEDIKIKLVDEVVVQIDYIYERFFALTKSGKIIDWSNNSYSRQIPEDIKIKLVDEVVIQILNISTLCVVLTKTGKVFTWSIADNGDGVPDYIPDKLKDVRQIYSNFNSFVALLENGEIVACGDSVYGGKIPYEIQSKLIDVVHVFKKINMRTRRYDTYVALTNKGEIIIWGNTLNLKLPKNKYFIPYYNTICQKYNLSEDSIGCKIIQQIDKNNVYNNKSNHQVHNNLGRERINININLDIKSYYCIMKANTLMKEYIYDGVSVDVGGPTKTFFTRLCNDFYQEYLYEIYDGSCIFKKLDISKNNDKLKYYGFMIGRMIILGLYIPFKFHKSIIWQINNYDSVYKYHIISSINMINYTIEQKRDSYYFQNKLKENEKLKKLVGNISDNIEATEFINKIIKENEETIQKLEESISSLNSKLEEFKEKKLKITQDEEDRLNEIFKVINLTRSLDDKESELLRLTQDKQNITKLEELNRNISSIKEELKSLSLKKTEITKRTESSAIDYYEIIESNAEELFISGLKEADTGFGAIYGTPATNINIYYKCDNDYYNKITKRLTEQKLMAFFAENKENITLLKHFNKLATGLECANIEIKYNIINIVNDKLPRLFVYHTCTDTVDIYKNTIDKIDSKKLFEIIKNEIMTHDPNEYNFQ